MIKEYFYKQKMKSKLLDCFRSSGLYLTSHRSNRTIYIYPKIHAVVRKEQENSTYITFTLLNGIDPKELKKKLYIFQQYFGRSIDLQGDLKKYTLFIYHKPLKSNLIYNYQEISSYIKDVAFPIVTGQKKNGRYLILDALELPHVIIQGTTGSGKSSAIRVIITTLIKYFKPSELDIYCIDGKKAEFGLFKKVEHIQSVVHSNKHARQTLSYVLKEMTKREDLLDTFDVPHINDLPVEHKQKYILIAVDEFIEYLGDKHIMESIIKITSKGRAVGIILLASAQRMDADIMDTKARTNFNIRMSFRAVDRTNAMLLGTKGAELIKREEKGRFILNSGEIEELQSPHLTYEKAKELLNPYCVIKRDAKEVNEDSYLNSESNKNNELDFFM